MNNHKYRIPCPLKKKLMWSLSINYFYLDMLASKLALVSLVILSQTPFILGQGTDL